MTEAGFLTDLLTMGRIGRREFLGRMSALGVSATAIGATGLLAAPGGANAQAPKSGGHMRFAIGHGDTADTLDPAHVNNGFLAASHYTITNMLTEIAPDGSLQPKLATGWSASADASAWTFEVRKGVTFHNGKDVTAADIIASINHHRGPESTSAAKPLVDPIEEIRADGKHIVVFDLNAGDADFPFKLADFNFPIYPANDDGSLDWVSGNGCGAYVLKDFEPGVRATFERNPNYWQLGMRAHFDSAEMLSVLDTTARQNALVTGEVEGIDRIDLKTADRMSERNGVTVREVPGKVHYTFPMRTDIAPFDNVDVRLALKYAIDREALLRTVLYGRGTIGNDNPISPAYRYHDANLAQRSYDPEKARFHLKKAGLSGLSVNLSAADAAFAGAVDAAVLFREHASKAGIEINVVREPGDGYWSNVWMKKPWSVAYWFGTPTADGIFTQAYSGGASWNDSYWDNPRFNELLVSSRAELDTKKRAAMYAEMQLLVRDDGGVIIPLFANDVFAISDKIGHAKLGNDLEVDGRKFLERWWFA